MSIKKGINTKKKLINAANNVEIGKLNDFIFNDFIKFELSIKEDSTCKIVVEIKFQKTKPLKAYNEKFFI